jgi:hypothetical protein
MRFRSLETPGNAVKAIGEPAKVTVIYRGQEMETNIGQQQCVRLASAGYLR